MDIYKEVREVSIQHHRNKSQIMVLESIKDKQLIVSAEKTGLGKEKPRKRIQCCQAVQVAVTQICVTDGKNLQ